MSITQARFRHAEAGGMANHAVTTGKELSSFLEWGVYAALTGEPLQKTMSISRFTNERQSIFELNANLTKSCNLSTLVPPWS